MPQDEDIERRILAYLVQSPEAQDTLEGVANWWLLQQRITECIDEVQAALGALADEGLIILRHGGGKTVYRLNSEKLEAVRRRLNELGE